MELRQLQYFVAVVEEGTVSGAARRLNMSQPPLSAQIHALEADVGCALFEHAGRRLRLTAAGAAFYDRACSILQLCGTARAEMAAYGSGRAGTLRVGVVSSVCSTLFVSWLGRYAAVCPDTCCELQEANTYQLLERLAQRQIDLAIVRTPFSAPEFDCLPLQREPMMAVACPDLLEDETEAENAAPLPLAELAGHPLILYRRWEDIVRGQFQLCGAQPHVRCVCDAAVTALRLAQTGMGVALVPASAAVELPQQGLRARPVAEPALFSRIAVLTRRGDVPAQAAVFLQQLADSATDCS